MPTAWSSTLRIGNRVRGVDVAARSPFAQGLALLMIAVGLVVMIPLMVIALIAVVVLFATRRIGRAVRSLSSPNGPLDGRRNVRVRPPAGEP